MSKFDKDKTYICHACGETYRKWVGTCANCHEWGSVSEMDDNQLNNKKQQDILISSDAKILHPISISDIQSEEHERTKTDLEDFDVVLGGGLVASSVLLLGGDPGIGKSTILLQIAHIIASKKNKNVLYITGEESLSQVKMRATRLGAGASSLQLLSTTSLESIQLTVSNLKGIDLIVIDSIQTMLSSKINASTGSIAQVKLCTHELVSLAKNNNIIILLIGHVTKDGSVAGPKFLEHMVDGVFYFEGEQNFRILRSIKNRYGSTGEIALFEMKDTGLVPVVNASVFFLSNSYKNVSGSIIFAGLEGTRVIMSEIQALISYSNAPIPRRVVVGYESNRLSMILAVLSSRYKLNIHDKDIYLNVVGGLKINDPSADLAVAAALISICFESVLAEGTVVFGEIGLVGEVRNAQNTERRLKEAAKLGFKHAIIPNCEIIDPEVLGAIKIIHLNVLGDLVKLIKNNCS